MSERENNLEFGNAIGDVINNFVDRGIVSSEEASKINSKNLDEITIRLGHDFDELSKMEDFKQEQKDKIRTMLGLNQIDNDKEIEGRNREQEIQEFIVEMREYLEGLKKEIPAVSGLLLMGSRMNAGKMPKKESDADIMIILENGTNTEPDSENGEKLLDKFREYEIQNKTKSGIEVGMDDFYTPEELSQSLDKDLDDIPKSIRDNVLWNMNTNALKYVGSDLEWKGEEVNEDIIDNILKSKLNSEKGVKVREKLLEIKKQEVLK